MFSKGSRLFLGLGVAAYLAAILYGIVSNAALHGGVVATLTGNGVIDTVLGPLTMGYKGGVGDHIGFGVLIGCAAAFIGVGLASSAFRDGDPEALAQLAGKDSPPPVQPVAAPSVWPVVMAFGAACVTLGLAVGTTLLVVGVAVVLVAGIEWTMLNWSDTSTGDPAVNREIRNQLMHPVEFPVAAVALIGAVVLCFSRIFLTFDKSVTVWVALALLVAVFATAAMLARAPELKRSVLVGVVMIGAVVTLALGIIGAVRGQHEASTEHSSPAATSQQRVV